MLKAAKKYGVRLDVKNPSETLKEALPIWSHIGVMQGRVMSNSRTSRCIRENHGVVTVGACLNLARRLSLPSRTAQNVAHVPSARCPCTECEADRSENGCTNPHRCAAAAHDLLRKLQPAWVPDGARHSDGLSLTKSRKRKNTTAREHRDRILFNPSASSTLPLADTIRAF
ncbi:uncharacterized protein TRAVEDRAFT_127747, partial [Trametes versicolor FP-101664 SS1]|uniref:uncharacterized protein n=1 Tax=Trametes versicolor (strain FP-101664) TaxID=717944 RepID=UPI0004623D68